MWYLTGIQCQKLRMRVICDEREQLTIQATEFCAFISNEENTLEDRTNGHF